MFTQLFEEFAKELKDANPMDRATLARGYAKHAEAILLGNLKSMQATFQDEPIETAMEALASAIEELETGKAPYDEARAAQA